MLELLVAIVMFVVILRVGLAVIRMLATPPPAPPPPGEMRKVNLRYRCGECGAEVKMTLAADQVPDAPRHCLEDMDLVSTPDD